MGETEPGWDDRLLGELRTLLARAEPPPAWVLALGRAAIEMPDLDAELATLVWDSAVHDPAVAVRDTAVAGQVRDLSFEGSDLSLEVSIDLAGGTVTGMLVPPQPARIELLWLPAGATAVGGEGADTALLRRVPLEADELGRFAGRLAVDGVAGVGRVEVGTLRLVCHRDGVPAVATAWVVLESGR